MYAIRSYYELSNAHEFYADQKVVENSQDSDSYSRLILRLSSNKEEHIPLTHQFSKYNIKQRITMLNKKKTVRPVAQAGYEEGYLESLHITWANRERGRGPTGRAIRSNEPSIAKDILNDPSFAPWRARNNFV